MLKRALAAKLGRFCRPLNKSAFRTRVMDAELIVEVPRQRPGPNRPAQLYRLKDRRNAVFFPRTFSPRVD